MWGFSVFFYITAQLIYWVLDWWSDKTWNMKVVTLWFYKIVICLSHYFLHKAIHQTQKQNRHHSIPSNVILHLVNFQLVLCLFDHFIWEAEMQLICSEGRHALTKLDQHIVSQLHVVLRRVFSWWQTSSYNWN